MANEQEIKMKILDEIKNMMDSKMVDGLKSKSPKFMEVKTNDPSMAESLKSKLMPEGSQEEEQSEGPMEALKEKLHPEMEGMEPKGEEDDSDLSEDDLKRLMGLLK